MPSKQTAGSAGHDLFSPVTSEVPPFGWEKIPLGLVMEMPRHHCGLIYSRSGLSLRGLVVANGVGVIDNDYRGELSVIMHNRTGVPFLIEEGDRIAQLIVMAVPVLTFLEMDDVDKLTRTDRSADGFGSTGA